MKKAMRITALALALILFAGCGQTIEVKADDEGDYVLASQMSEEAAQEIKEITDVFSAALKEKSAAKIMGYLDEDFTVTEEELNAFFAEATSGEKSEYEIFDTYYVNGIKNSDASIRIKKSEDDGDYAMLTPGSKEISATLFVAKGEKISQMITLLIAKIGGSRKIVWIDTSDYAYFGKTAPEYYELAKKAVEKGHEIAGYVYVQMMYNICQPGNVLYYKDTTAMSDYANERSAWGKELFPIELLNGTRKLHLIGLALENEGVIPMIFYQTDVDLKSAELKEDAMNVKKAFVEKYPYMAEYFSKVTVRATNVDPSTATEQYDYESFVFDMK